MDMDAQFHMHRKPGHIQDPEILVRLCPSFSGRAFSVAPFPELSDDIRSVSSFDGPSAFLATLLILHFCCVLVKCFCYMENKLSLSLNTVISGMHTMQLVTNQLARHLQQFQRKK